MFRLKQIRTASTLVSVLVFIYFTFTAIAAHTATYYVATTGSNSNPGTSSQPWRTVAYATSKMIAGDTTYVQGGTYTEGVIRFGKSGTQAAPIRLLNAPGQFPIIKFIDPNQTHRALFQNNAGSQKAIGWITIEGFELKNGYDGIKIYNGHDLTIRRNWIHDSLNQGILGNGTRILIDRNRINHNGNTGGNQKHGIYMNGTAITITNNIIYDNQYYGIQANGSSSYNSSMHTAPEFAVSRNWVISNNTIGYNRNRAGIVVWGSTLTNLRIENNILYENGSALSSSSVQGIDFVSMTSTGITIKNNLAFASGSGAMNFLGSGAIQGVHYTQSGNIVNTLNPKFVNAPATLPASPNFSLTSASQAIDKGLPLSETKIAYDGTIRPKLVGYDVGAYEYYGSAQLAAPTSLQAIN